ncbi:unnamed protein product [Closterium sp. NIES-54]
MLGEGEQRSFMVVYVDDIFIFSPSSDLVKEVMLKLQDKFKCKALGDVSFYLGLHIECDVEKRCMRVHQRKYLEALAANFGQSEGHVATPFPSGFKCVKGPEEESVGEEERRRFHSVGSLMYAAVNTRPDIAFATGQLARVVQCPIKEQVAAGMRVAKYLGQTATNGLQFSAAAQRRQKGADGVEPGRLFLTAFSDASYASEPEDMTSVGGFTCCVGGGPTAWESKKQVVLCQRTGNETRSTGGQVGLYHPPFEKCGLPGSSLQEGATYCDYNIDYAASLVAESVSASVCPPSVVGECALGTDVFEDKQEDLERFAAASPHQMSMLLAPEGDPDALDIPTPRSYAEAIEGPYSSQWQAAKDSEMAPWKSTGTYIDKVPPPGANNVCGMWIFRWHDTLTTTLLALGFAPSTADPSLFLRTDATLPPFYVLVYVDDLFFATADTEALAHVKSELQKRHTWTDLGELTSDLGLRITRDRAQRTITLTQSHMVQQVLQRFGFTYSSPQSTPLPTGHSLSAPPSDESVEPSGPYPKLVGCLMYLMTCTRLDLAYPLSLLARYVARGRHRKVHWDAAKRVLRYLCSTSAMGLVLGGRARVVLTGHADASWVDDLATQRSSHGYTFSLGSDSVSWRSTRSSSVLSSSCEAEIYAGAMAA